MSIRQALENKEQGRNYLKSESEMLLSAPQNSEKITWKQGDSIISTQDPSDA